MPLNELMSLPKNLALPTVTHARRWWQRLAPNRQDRFAMLAPLAAVMLFFLVIVTILAYLRVEEMDREQEAVQRDVEYSQQRLRLRLLERQEQFTRIARELSNHELSAEAFKIRSEAMRNLHPELETMAWFDARLKLKAVAGEPFFSKLQSQGLKDKGLGLNEEAIAQAQQSNQPVYWQRLKNANATPYLQIYTPLYDRNQFTGVLLAELSVDALYRYGVPVEVSAHYAMSLLDANGNVLAGNSMLAGKKPKALFLPLVARIAEYSMPVSPIGASLVIHGQAYRASLGLIGSGLFWLVTALSMMTAWMLIANWRHTRKRLQTQQALVSETNFRRAMENSMLTGMRAMDMAGRITYVNAAFCQMTGWSELDLVGRTAPFPYWPEADQEQLMARLDEELSGKHTPGGFQVRVKRRDSSMFDARLYVSPLIDAKGMQTGWVTSMTDITEPTRVREQLFASHERFTTVLEALDASISVAPLGSEELLFANKMYRQWFGTHAKGHLELVAQSGLPSTPVAEESLDDVDAYAGLPTSTLSEIETKSGEIFDSNLEKWLEVRTQYISWVDGRLAQMVIATDITSRRLAEQQAAIQAERAQTSSRLMTMGEMASSVAHELNQPLTAINNYCNGMVTRIKNQKISQEDLLVALEKTAHQAQRAGQIIQRIRTFVKRSEPNRSASEIELIVWEAIELAEIELRRRNVRLIHFVAANLPLLMVDPILIEQVLVNLLRNAAESIDTAQRPSVQRRIELRIVPIMVEQTLAVEFSVQDTGKGLAPEVMQRLYEAFYSTKANGMGIGLSLCRSIVESHLGRMKAENIYNNLEITGCRFSFWIPIPKSETS
jgi:PAS domain S-box-containing protein